MTPEDFLSEYESSLATQDWSVVEPLMHPDISVTFSSGTFKGLSQVKAAFEKTFNTIKEEKYSISNVYWVHKGSETAVCMYHFAWRGLINGQTQEGSGRGTSVLINAGNKWLLITEHLGPHAS